MQVSESLLRCYLRTFHAGWIRKQLSLSLELLICPKLRILLFFPLLYPNRSDDLFEEK